MTDTVLREVAPVMQWYDGSPHPMPVAARCANRARSARNARLPASFPAAEIPSRRSDGNGYDYRGRVWWAVRNEYTCPSFLSLDLTHQGGCNLYYPVTVSARLDYPNFERRLISAVKPRISWFVYTFSFGLFDDVVFRSFYLRQQLRLVKRSWPAAAEALDGGDMCHNTPLERSEVRRRGALVDMRCAIRAAESNSGL